MFSQRLIIILQVFTKSTELNLIEESPDLLNFKVICSTVSPLVDQEKLKNLQHYRTFYFLHQEEITRDDTTFFFLQKT